MRLFEGRIMELAAILNHAEDRRRAKRLERTRARLAAAGEKLPPLLQSLQRCTQHTVKLIRWNLPTSPFRLPAPKPWRP